MLTSKGEGGGPPNATILHKPISLFSKFVNEEGGGGRIKDPQNFVNVVYGCPLMGKMEHEKRTNPLTKFHGENFLTEKRNVWLFFDV